MTQVIIPKGFLEKLGAPDDLRQMCLASVAKARNSGSRVKAAREYLGLPQKACGELLGISRRGLQDIEAQKNVPSGQSLAALLGLGINVNWVLSGEGPRRLADAGGSERPTRLDVGRLKSAVRLLEMALDLAGRDMAPADKADLVADLYGWLSDRGDALTPDNVVDLNQYLSARLK